ncbi:MAG: RNA polymerase sigma factor [Burkholderiaceae bacterium]
MHSAVHDTIAAIWRIESARIVAAVARRVRDVGTAEELAQDALVAALEHWPLDGLPDRPAAWLMTTALNRAMDHLRHRQMADARHEDIAADHAALQTGVVPDFSDDLDRQREQAGIGDDLLRLMFTACHPILGTDARVALTLKLLGGLGTAEIARAFLVPEATIAQRMVRAKRTLSDAGIPFEVPRGDELARRLASVLEVVYLIFNEGYTATSGTDWMRPALCDEALRLGRMLAELAPHEPEVHGLVALMELQASRTPARTDAGGQPILLADQNRARWDHLLIQRGLAALARARRLDPPAGSYRLQAEIAACHALARHVDDTDWSRIAALYGELMRVAPSPVIELNRAVAVGMAAGPAAGLAIVETLMHEKAMQRYHWLPAVQGDFLFRLGRPDEARRAFERAAGLASNQQEKTWMLRRAAASAGHGTPSCPVHSPP